MSLFICTIHSILLYMSNLAHSVPTHCQYYATSSGCRDGLNG